MIIYITEKPSLAKSIAKGIGVQSRNIPSVIKIPSLPGLSAIAPKNDTGVKNNQDYQNFKNATLARSRADWLVILILILILIWAMTIAGWI